MQYKYNWYNYVIGLRLSKYRERVYVNTHVWKNNASTTNNECIDILAKKLNITEEEKSLCFPSAKKRVFYDRVNWAKTYMKKAGLVEA